MRRCARQACQYASIIAATKNQGIDREPQAVLPPAILYSERHSGKSTPAGDDIRARHRERVEARRQGPEELARVLERQRREGRQSAIQWAQRRKGEKKIPNGALTRDQLKEKRREYCKANQQEINRKQRERRRANADEVNRKQREYLRRRQAEKKAAQASLNPQEQQPVKAKARALRSAEQNAAQPGPASSPTTAEESVKNWLAFRKNDQQVPDAESLNHWLAYRERQTETASSSKSATQDRSRDPDGGASGNQDSEAAERNSTHGRHNDVAL